MFFDQFQIYGGKLMMDRLVGCRAKFGIEEMCRDQWNWASKNPYGYQGSQPVNSNGLKAPWNGSVDHNLSYGKAITT
jgi:UDP-glucose 4-epimerase